MTLFDDVHRLQGKCRELESQVDDAVKQIAVLQEQISGERGINAAIKELAHRLGGLTRAAWSLAGIIVAAAITFAFGVLALIP